MKLLLRIFLFLSATFLNGYGTGYAYAKQQDKHFSAKQERQLQLVRAHNAESYSLAPFTADEEHVSDYLSETEDENDETNETICVKGKCTSNYFGTFYGKAPPGGIYKTRAYLPFYKHLSFSSQNTYIVFRSIRI
jgi:hypothetical protein